MATELHHDADKSLGEIVTEVSEKASLLVREEIELAKAEVQQKMSRLAKGAAAAGAAGVLLVFALVYFLHAVAWFLNDLLDTSSVWLGYLITAGGVLLLGAIAGLLALRLFRRGTPPTPELAIEEAKRTRETLERQKVLRDQLERGRERGEDLEASVNR